MKKTLLFYSTVVLTCVVVLALLSGCPPKEEPPALGQPLNGLTAEQLDQFNAGKAVFQRAFTQDDGLGPLFNADGCIECHETPELGGVGDEVEVHAARFIAPSTCDPLFQEGGPVIQQHANLLLQGHGIMREEIPVHATASGHRSTPPVFGLGLVDGIPESTILNNEDPDDRNHDGISGRVNRTIDGRVGRFGRKAAVASLLDFSEGAFPFEQGITTPSSPVEETINGVPVPPDTDPAADPEISDADIQKANTFMVLLAPPPKKKLTTQAEIQYVERGKRFFSQLKCSSCHVPEMTTGPNSIRALDKKPVALYSDLLLHDMGPDLADICMNLALPSEFRTEMLMGLRFRKKFLHDGSADSVQTAIKRHGGEAQQSRDSFMRLSDSDKESLLMFLDSI